MKLGEVGGSYGAYFKNIDGMSGSDIQVNFYDKWNIRLCVMQFEVM